MDFLHTINKEYDMDDVFNKLEEGLEVFEKLVSCMNLFPNYDLKRDLEESYLEKKNSMVKKFIKSGVSFVKNNEVKVRNFIDFIKNRESDNILQELTFINPVSDTKLDLKDFFPMMIQFMMLKQNQKKLLNQHGQHLAQTIQTLMMTVKFIMLLPATHLT